MSMTNAQRASLAAFFLLAAASCSRNDDPSDAKTDRPYAPDVFGTFPKDRKARLETLMGLDFSSDVTRPEVQSSMERLSAYKYPKASTPSYLICAKNLTNLDKDNIESYSVHNLYEEVPAKITFIYYRGSGIAACADVFTSNIPGTL